MIELKLGIAQQKPDLKNDACAQKEEKLTALLPFKGGLADTYIVCGAVAVIGLDRLLHYMQQRVKCVYTCIDTKWGDN